MLSGEFLNDLCKRPYLITENDTVISVSSIFLKLTGYTEEDILQKTTQEVLNCLLRTNANFQELELPQDKYYFILTKSLELIETKISVVDDINNKKRYYILSENQKLEINKNMLFLDKLFDDNHLGVAIFSSPDFILLKCNQKYSEYLGEPFDKKENCIGFGLDYLLPDFQNSKSEESWKNIISSGKTAYLNEFRGGIGGMKGRYWENSITPIVFDGRTKYVVSTLIDIT